MAGNIKGIIVEIGGDTSGLQKALKSANSATASLSKELRGINSLLKLDPSNITLISQKHKVLKQTIRETKNELDLLKTAQKQFKDAGGDLNSKEYRNLQREIINTQQKLKQLKQEASVWNEASKGLSRISEAFSKLGDKISDVGSKLTKTLTTSIGALGTAGVTYNAQIEKYAASFETFLGTAEKASEAVNNIKQDAAKTPYDTKTLVQANMMLISTGETAEDTRKVILDLGNAIAATGGGNAELERMSANLQQIKNAGKATALDIKQFAYAGIDIYGLLAQATGKNVAEVKEMDVTYEELTKALSMASAEGGKYAGAMDRISQTTSGQFSVLKANLQDLLGQLTASLMPTIKKITEFVNNLANKFRALSDEQKQTITKVLVFAAAIGPALLILGKLFSALGLVIGIFAKFVGTIGNVISIVGFLASKILFVGKIFITFFGTLLKTVNIMGIAGKAVALFTNPIGIAVAAITTIIGAIAILYNKCEWFRNGVNTIVDNIKSTFSNVVNGIGQFFNETLPMWFTGAIQWFMSIPENIKNAFNSIITYISGAFTSAWTKAWQGIKDIFKMIIEGLANIFKVPINAIIGLMNKFIGGLNKIKIPDWVPGVGGKGINIPMIPKLAKGGIVDSATLAMIGEGKSPEAVIPLDGTLTKYFSKALKEAGNANNMTVNFYPQSMTEAEMDRAFNYMNRRFGMSY